jgi:site-specific DNA-methyltransferase (adenine-specific)
MLFYGDNLEIFRRYGKDKSVDLIYLDPPFNSKATYNALFKTKDGQTKIKAFDDTWHWDMGTQQQYQEVVERGGSVADALRAFRVLLGTNDMLAYLTMLAPRLVEMRRVLKPTGSIYLHCDPTASHYIKVLMDAVFGSKNYKNEIVWHYTLGGVGKKSFGKKHDIIFFYTKTSKYKFYPDRVRIKRTEEVLRRIASGSEKATRSKTQDKRPIDVWEIQALNSQAKERLGYPTQKPLELVKKIILASSDEGDRVLDPFCGCGTTIHAAEELGRKWIGIDVARIAISLTKKRLRAVFGKGLGVKIKTHTPSG